MRRLLIVAIMTLFVPLAGSAFAAGDGPSGKGQGQGQHDCHKPKPPETS